MFVQTMWLTLLTLPKAIETKLSFLVVLFGSTLCITAFKSSEEFNSFFSSFSNLAHFKVYSFICLPEG